MATTKWLEKVDEKVAKRRKWQKERRMKKKQKKQAALGVEGSANANTGQQLPNNNVRQQLPNNNIPVGFQDTVNMYTGTTDFCNPQIGGMSSTSFIDNSVQWQQQQQSGSGGYVDAGSNGYAGNNMANSYASNDTANSYPSNNTANSYANNNASNSYANNNQRNSYSIDTTNSQGNAPTYSNPIYQDNGSVNNTQQMMADGGGDDEGGYSRKRKGYRWKGHGGKYASILWTQSLRDDLMQVVWRISR